MNSTAERLIRSWVLTATLTTVLWGVWGALIEIPEKAGFPATLGYTVWALTMIPCSLAALAARGWKLEYDRRSVILGSIVGLLGAAGQLVLFEALRHTPAYLVFPIVSLYPVLTVALASTVLKERASRRIWAGIVIALAAVVFLSYQPPSQGQAANSLWLLAPALVFVAWGVQAFVMKLSNNTMQAESIFFYMAATAVALAPFAVAMTDFSRPINWGFRGPGLAFLIQILNSLGALTLVYALRYGAAIVVVPLTSLAPAITVVLSLLLYGVVPGAVLSVGLLFAIIAIVLMAE